MSRSKDYAPIGNTCPMIDDVIGFIDTARIDYSDDDSEVLFKNAMDTMENIRSANLELRNWGNEEYRRAEEFEKEVDYLRSEVKRLQEDIKYMEDSIE